MAAFNFHRRKTRRWWYAGVTLVAAAFFSVFFVVGASATLTTGGGTFDTSNGTLTSTTFNDWNPAGKPTGNVGPVQTITCPTSAPGSVQDGNCALDLVGSTSDNSLGQGTKEDDVSPTVVSGSIPPNKDDLSRFYINQQLATQDGSSGTGTNAISFHKGDNLLYLAWERSNLLGSAHMDFELNQDSVGISPTTKGTVDINRTPGDVLIDFDFGGSGQPVLQWHKWLTTANAPTGVASADCAASTTFPCWGVAKDIGAAGEASVNGAAVNDYNAPVPTCQTAPCSNTLQGTTTLDKNGNPKTVSSTFGEAGIDLQASGIFSSFQCTRFGDAWLKSRSSGNSFTSELKDFIAPLPIDISNCGEIRIIKNTDPRNVNKDFSYSTNVPSGGATNAAAFSTTPTSTGTTTGFALNDRNDVTISSVTPGDPNTTVTLNKVVTLTNGQNVTISGSNTTPLIDGTFAVSNVSSTATQTSFTIPFVTSAVPQSGATGSLVFNTEDITNVVPNGTNGAPATYTVAETVPAGWGLESLGCTSSTGSTGVRDGTTSTVDITVVSGGVVTCTYQNQPLQGALLINKNSLKSGSAVLKAGAQFCYSTTTPDINNDPVCDSTGTVVTDLGPTGTVGSTGDQSLTTGVICVKGLAPGTYYINETSAPTGYGLVTSGQTNQSVTVVNGTNCSTSLPSSAATGKVTFTDPPLADVIIAFRDGGSGETSLAKTMTCSADNSTGTDAATGTGFGTPSGWTTSDAIKGVQIGSSNVTVTCTAVIDP